MKLLTDLLGLAVLTSPLWLIVILIPVAIWIAVKVAKRAGGVGARIGVGILSFVIVVLAPFADQIIGRMFLNHLCATASGARVYHTVGLPPEYWDEQGRPKFVKQNGDLDRKVLGARFSEPAKSEPYLSALGITEYHQQVVDNSNHQVLGEVVDFMFWGGWIVRNLSASTGAVGCREIRNNKVWRDFYPRLFTKSNASE